ncbi:MULTISPECIES: GtrA family protein [unclassified Sporolactobacillus]|uniref:GtrA family protein n=1 Tax=unclassified Sporolactobacillus TaxID=2628533 RepID=UPI00236867EC|nr:GtrA family protein [Sporolactobacillus sp. CQH2019]MDD9147234.1 GtrA family protein [Sporolactobacillus sp. CQH2019]
MSETRSQSSQERSGLQFRLRLIKQAAAFGTVGVLNTAVDFIVFVLLTHFFSLFYALAQILSYGAGMLNSYFLNSRFTFSNSAKSKSRFIRFTILNLAVLLMTLLVMHGLLFLPLYADKLISTLVGLIFNFVLSKFWVFKA